MKGIILAGGTGSRLDPCTKVTNKHLLPVYNKPMIMYPLQTLMDAGIRDIMIVSGRGHAGHFLELLGSGQHLGLRLQYAVQEKAGGIAEALGLTEDFADGEAVAVILGDNIYELPQDLSEFKSGGRIYLKKVSDPHRFGVVEFDGERVVRIIEKPKEPPSDAAVTGLYVYDARVYSIIKTLKPSGRGELEITDVNNAYLDLGELDFRIVEGEWTDAGTFESLYRAATLARKKAGD
jgi:glucose-1-phosphate thymidylyltransferase